MERQQEGLRQVGQLQHQEDRWEQGRRGRRLRDHPDADLELLLQRPQQQQQQQQPEKDQHHLDREEEDQREDLGIRR